MPARHALGLVEFDELEVVGTNESARGEPVRAVELALPDEVHMLARPCHGFTIGEPMTVFPSCRTNRAASMTARNESNTSRSARTGNRSQ